MSDQNTDEISLKELILKTREWKNYLFSRWKMILFLGVAGGILGVAYSYTKKPIYTAALSFALEDEKVTGGGLGGALGLASQFGFDMGGNAGGAFSGANLLELIKSRTLVEKTLLNPVILEGKTISLVEMYLDFNKIRDNWKKTDKLNSIHFKPNADRIKFTRDQDSILGVIYGSLIEKDLTVVQKDKKIAITTVEVKSENELFAKYFTEELLKEVSNFYIETKSKKAKLNLNILEKQTDSIRNALNNSISGEANAEDKTFNLNPALNTKRVPSVRHQVDVKANTAILTELVKNLELAKVTLRKETPLIQVIDQPILPLKKEHFGKVKGFVLGSFLGFFLIIFFLFVKKICRDAME